MITLVCEHQSRAIFCTLIVLSTDFVLISFLYSELHRVAATTMVRLMLILAIAFLAVSTTAQSPTLQPTAGPPTAGGGDVEPTQTPIASANSETLAPTLRNVTITDTASPAPSASDSPSVSQAPLGAPTDRCIGGDGTV